MNVSKRLKEGQNELRPYKLQFVIVALKKNYSVITNGPLLLDYQLNLALYDCMIGNTIAFLPNMNGINKIVFPIFISQQVMNYLKLERVSSCLMLDVLLSS